MERALWSETRYGASYWAWALGPSGGSGAQL
jgi:hypothetical protein